MAAPAHSFLIEPFDIGMHSTEIGVMGLHTRLTQWLRTLTTPARFGCWLLPATLNDKIDRLSALAHHTADPTRTALLMEYRRQFETLQASANYQRSVCGLMLWSEDTTAALAKQLTHAFETVATAAPWPPLFDGQYHVRRAPFPHLAPVGRPGGRLQWAILSSYEFLPATWNFFKPTKALLAQGFPFALALDLPHTLERTQGIEAVENNLTAFTVHLAQLRGAEDSRAVTRIQDCRRALQEMNEGDALHHVQLTLAVAAGDLPTLKERVQILTDLMRPYVRLRQESGELLAKAVHYFTDTPSNQLHLPDTSWRVTSRELALMFAPLGYRKLETTDGILRGEAVEGGFPVFHNSWRDKRATHEIWVGATGSGKTFMNNCYLLREYAENGIAFDLLEPMGHGRHIAHAIGIEAYSLSARRSRLNPQDVYFPTLTEQKSHTIRLYETVLGRPLTGGQTENMERGLLGEALDQLYRPFSNLSQILPENTPICADLCAALGQLGETPRKRHLAQALADEISSLCCGSGPWAGFLNGTTNVDLSRRGRDWIPPRIFCFDEMNDDPIMLALAYTQVLSALRRDSLIDEVPRIIVVDEVYRLMRYEALLDFLIEAAKTFRTRRKKLICIDQNMLYFVTGKARYVFENSPIRVIFNQGQGIDVFNKDAAFQHLNAQHKSTIAALQRFHYVFDVIGEGIWHIHNMPSMGELARFSMT